MGKEKRFMALDMTAIAGLGQLFAGEEETLWHILQTYVDDGDRIIAAIAQMDVMAEPKAIGEQLHTLKSSSFMIGAQQLGDHCLALEKRAMGRKQEEFWTLFAQVQAEYGEVRQALVALLAHSPDRTLFQSVFSAPEI